MKHKWGGWVKGGWPTWTQSSTLSTKEGVALIRKRNNKPQDTQASNDKIEVHVSGVDRTGYTPEMMSV
jgi:hypothetical protein